MSNQKLVRVHATTPKVPTSAWRHVAKQRLRLKTQTHRHYSRRRNFRQKRIRLVQFGLFTRIVWMRGNLLWEMRGELKNIITWCLEIKSSSLSVSFRLECTSEFKLQKKKKIQRSVTCLSVDIMFLMQKIKSRFAPQWLSKMLPVVMT